MNTKLNRELKKLSEHHTKKDQLSSLGNGQFSMPNTSKRSITKKRVSIVKNKNNNKISIIRVGKNFQAMVPLEPDYSSQFRPDILIIKNF